MTLENWPVLGEEEVLKTPVFSVRRQVCRSPKDGQDKAFTVLDLPDWVQVLALTDDNRALLVRQYRFGTRQISLELPGGVIEPGQSPLSAAQRELREETGYTAERWRQVAAFRPNPAIQNNTAYFFLAEGARLTHPTEFDENEDLRLTLTPLDQLKKFVQDGAIDHVIMAAAILSYFQFLPCREVKE